jgi:hypothetical protein
LVSLIQYYPMHSGSVAMIINWFIIYGHINN